MHGYVTTRHLITYGRLIAREFGFACYARCVRRALLSRRPCTFLECINSQDRMSRE